VNKQIYEKFINNNQEIYPFIKHSPPHYSQTHPICASDLYAKPLTTDTMNKPQHASVILLMAVISLMPELFAQDTIRSSVFFGYNKQEIGRNEQSRLDSLLNALGDCPVRYIRITGNTDASGSAEYNQRLSAERAREVYDYLASKGMKSEQLEILSQGKSLPLYRVC